MMKRIDWSKTTSKPDEDRLIENDAGLAQAWWKGWIDRKRRLPGPRLMRMDWSKKTPAWSKPGEKGGLIEIDACLVQGWWGWIDRNRPRHGPSHISCLQDQSIRCSRKFQEEGSTNAWQKIRRWIRECMCIGYWLVVEKIIVFAYLQCFRQRAYWEVQ